MDIFDVIGPVMIGPSSSHTAGAVKIGRAAGGMLGEKPAMVVIHFYGSFAHTYKGHGTDKAVIGGLLGMQTDDERIRDSLQIAFQKGLKYSFICEENDNVHPNTARIDLEGVYGKLISIVASSIGGGSIVVTRVGNYDVSFTGEYATLIIPHRDTPGTIANVTGVLAGTDINIAQMKVYRSGKGCEAIMVIETDQRVPEKIVDSIKGLPGIFDSMEIERL